MPPAAAATPSPLTQHRLALYGSASIVATSAVVMRAFRERSNFYAATVWLGRSNGCILVLVNFGIFCTILFGKFCQAVFFGQLRPIEVEHLYERSWYAVTETLLAMTIFRDQFDASFILLFGTLLFLKVFHWLCADRVELMEQTPSLSRLFHARMVSVLWTLFCLDLFLVAFAIEVLILEQQRMGIMIMFASEFTILTATLWSTIAKYVLNCIDLRSEEPWEGKSMYVSAVDLITDFLKLATYLCFFSLILTYYGLPLNIVRDVYVTGRSFFGRIRDLLRYRAATRNMDTRFPNATAQDLARTDATCIICRDEMIAVDAGGAAQEGEGGENAAQAPAAATPAAGSSGGSGSSGLNETPKKLICGHIFHFHCLRSWLERQQSCPTCRRTVFETTPPTATATARPGPGPQQQNAGPQQQQAGGGGAAAAAAIAPYLGFGQGGQQAPQHLPPPQQPQLRPAGTPAATPTPSGSAHAQQLERSYSAGGAPPQDHLSPRQRLQTLLNSVIEGAPMMGGGAAARPGQVAGPSAGWVPPPPDTLRPPQAGMGGLRSTSASWAARPAPTPVAMPQLPQPTPTPTRTTPVTNVEAGPSAAAASTSSSSHPTSPVDPTDPRAAARAAALRRFEALGSGGGLAPPGVGAAGRRVVTTPVPSAVVNDKGKGKAKATDIIAEEEEEEQEEEPAIASSTSLLSTSTALPTSSKLSIPSPSSSPSALTRDDNDNSQERRALVESQMRDLDDLGRRVWELQCELGRVWSAMETSGTMRGAAASEVTRKEKEKEVTTPQQPSTVPEEGQGVATGPQGDEARPPSSPHASS